jgi:hypothetical protein
MSGAGKRLTAGRLVSGIAATTAAVVIAGAALDDDSRLTAQASEHAGPCAAATAATIASVDATVARHIYMGELRSKEVSADIAHITGSRELLSALASSNEAAVYAAVHTIVYTPRWHIVRLRVGKNGRVLADVGGPYIIAPLSGVLRFKGRKVGSFVMSVQDDLGYVKLVSRFIGVPIDLYKTPPAPGSFVMGTLKPAPSSVNTGGSVTVAGHTYQAQVLDARAFPSGTLRVALFVPRPTGMVAAHTCAAVRVAAWGSVAMHIAARFAPLAARYKYLVDTLRGSTGGLAFVRAGSRRLAGGVGPARIPLGGTVKYGGRSWSVFSWEPVPPARIYLLTPAG